MTQITSLERLTEIIPDPSPMAAAKVLDHLDDQAMEFIARSPFLIMATDSEDGLDLSPKGDAPGFVHVIDCKTLLYPERNGNQLKMGLKNILGNGRIGMMFFHPNTGDVLRVIGRAELHDDAELCERLAHGDKPALLVIKIHIDRAFFHCPRAILRSKLWLPESWDAPSSIKMGKIYAKALAKPEVEAFVDGISAQMNDKLY